MLADLFILLHATLIGASNPGTNLRYELVVGFVKAQSDLACSIILQYSNVLFDLVRRIRQKDQRT